MSRRDATNYTDELDRYKEGLAEQIHIARDHLAQLEHEYARLERIDVEHDPDPSVRRSPGIDPRLFDLGTDEREAWRVPEERLPRQIVSVDTGGRT